MIPTVLMEPQVTTPLVTMAALLSLCLLALISTITPLLLAHSHLAWYLSVLFSLVPHLLMLFLPTWLVHQMQPMTFGALIAQEIQVPRLMHSQMEIQLVT